MLLNYQNDEKDKQLINNQLVKKIKDIAKKVELNVIEDENNLYIGVGENKTELTKGFYWGVYKDDVEQSLNSFDTKQQKIWLDYDKEQGIYAGAEKRYEIKKEWIEKIGKAQDIFNNKNKNIDLSKDEYEKLRPSEKMEYSKNILDSINENEALKESLNIHKESLDNQKRIDELKASIESEKEVNQGLDKDKDEKAKETTLSEEQKAYNKKEYDLLERQQVELERLEDEQLKIQARFEKSLDNLTNTKDVGGIIDFLKQLDNTIADSMEHADTVREVHKKQIAEKMELAFSNPKMKELVGDLVKEIYNGKSELEKNYEEMKDMQKSYKELNKDIIKNSGRDLNKKELNKFEEQFKNIKEKSPKFERIYPNTCKKANDIIKNCKEKLKNKNHEQEQGYSRSNEYGRD